MKQWWQGLPKWGKWTLGILGALVVIALISPASEEDQATNTAEDSSAPVSAGAGEPQADDGDAGCGNVASSDCTPHVGPNGQVRVDALIWSLESASTAESLGDQEFGLGETADGVFVVAKLRVRSDKDESATLTDNVWQLEVDGNTYDTDSDGMLAAMGQGDDEPFFLEDIGPDSTRVGTVVFDVPPSVLSKKLELRFNELGFGSGHGYIALPRLR